MQDRSNSSALAIVLLQSCMCQAFDMICKEQCISNRTLSHVIVHKRQFNWEIICHAAISLVKITCFKHLSGKREITWANAHKLGRLKMMTSWHGDALCIAVPLWGESTSYRLITHKGLSLEIWCFLCLNMMSIKQSGCWWFATTSS